MTLDDGLHPDLVQCVGWDALLAVGGHGQRFGLARRRRCHHVDMRARLNLKGYTAYSIGCAVVWAAVLAVVSTEAKADKFHRILLVFGGWVIGWVSATIARYVYPPPKSHRRRTGKS